MNLQVTQARCNTYLGTVCIDKVTWLINILGIKLAVHLYWLTRGLMTLQTCTNNTYIVLHQSVFWWHHTGVIIGIIKCMWCHQSILIALFHWYSYSAMVNYSPSDVRYNTQFTTLYHNKHPRWVMIPGRVRWPVEENYIHHHKNIHHEFKYVPDKTAMVLCNIYQTTLIMAHPS